MVVGTHSGDDPPKGGKGGDGAGQRCVADGRHLYQPVLGARVFQRGGDPHRQPGVLRAVEQGRSGAAVQVVGMVVRVQMDTPGARR